MSAATPTPVVEFEDPADLVEVELVPEYSLFARVGAEVFGTFVLVFLGVGAAVFSAVNGLATGIAIPLAFGIAVLGAASAVGHVSGGHFNPAVSLGAAIGGRISWADLLPYWAAQLIGGAAAGGVLALLVPASTIPDLRTTLFAPTLNGYGDFSPTFTATQGGLTFGLAPAIIAEIVATAIFVGVILGVTDKRASISYAPAAIGLTLSMLILVIAPITNASLNPARSTVSAIFAGEWGQLWVFWVAPLVGGALAALVYRLVTPNPVVEAAWPELEPVEEEAAEVEYDDDADAIDALLSRQAAAVPVEVVEAEAVAVEVDGVEVDGVEVDGGEVAEVIEVVEAEVTPDEDRPKA